MKIVSHSPSETRKFGRKLMAEVLKRAGERGCVVALHGDLGAGKTTLVKGMGSFLKIPESQISSPTFTLVHEYGPLVHVDLYRIENEKEALGLALEEYLGPGRVLVVEWPERHPGLPADVRVKIGLMSATERIVTSDTDFPPLPRH